jgi:hypothetical protein
VSKFRLNIDTGACYWAEHHDEFSDYGRLTVARWNEEQKLSLWMFHPNKPEPKRLVMNKLLIPSDYYEFDHEHIKTEA